MTTAERGSGNPTDSNPAPDWSIFWAAADRPRIEFQSFNSGIVDRPRAKKWCGYDVSSYFFGGIGRGNRPLSPPVRLCGPGPTLRSRVSVANVPFFNAALTGSQA